MEELLIEDLPICRAAKAAGGQSALARLLKVTPQAVQKMCASGRVPAERVLEIEKATGVSRHELRPDLYPTESLSAA
ncbi:DNA-binding transcriptional regulator YdaS, prophage-encoded, Cro superfamily [Pseudomonas mohnii]|uniref:DNA-binding transcriptional regulator YdaS, prophage-encoded, Cro superfamily n=1 Tax=Pseudomonas mohnii TaxID=395600 RepID=A0ABY0XRU1_9PSED|nr:YdaS family helix-turn-helix protein [Pseudomonas mohnii]SEC00799.1 DNA-binding transcriptional regulator YdaS, prophage-encoded, Cro superfamily [Pseudomonas mohnii]